MVKIFSEPMNGYVICYPLFLIGLIPLKNYVQGRCEERRDVAISLTFQDI